MHACPNCPSVLCSNDPFTSVLEDLSFEVSLGYMVWSYLNVPLQRGKNRTKGLFYNLLKLSSLGFENMSTRGLHNSLQYMHIPCYCHTDRILVSVTFQVWHWEMCPVAVDTLPEWFCYGPKVDWTFIYTELALAWVLTRHDVLQNSWTGMTEHIWNPST